VTRRLLLLGLLSGACSRAPEQAAVIAVPTATLEAVEARLGQADFALYDANPKEMFEAGHIHGARWVKFNEVTRAALPAAKDTELVFYCANELCTASDDAARSALALGFTRVEVMPAGYFGWRRSGRPVDEPAR
jgi:rhodanese-related sulfurtransferase